MNCPKCRAATWVTQTLPGVEWEVHRVRKCRQCGFRFKTFEMIDLLSIPEEVLERLEGDLE